MMTGWQTTLPNARFAPDRTGSTFSLDSVGLSSNKDYNGVAVAFRGVQTDYTGLIMSTGADSGITVTPPPTGMSSIGTSDFTVDAEITTSQRGIILEIGGGAGIGWSSLFLEVGADARVYVGLSYANAGYNVGGFYGDGTAYTGFGPIAWNRKTRITVVKQGTALKCYIDGVLKDTLVANGSLYNTGARPMRIGYGQTSTGARYSILTGVLHYINLFKSAKLP